MIKEVMADAHERMEKTIDALRHDLMSIRTGRASPALVEHLSDRILWHADATHAAWLRSACPKPSRL